MPGVMPVVGRTEAEAQAIFAELNRNIDTAQAFTVLSERLGTDMSVYPLDGPVPDAARDRASQEPRRAADGDGAARQAHPARSSTIASPPRAAICCWSARRCRSPT